MSMSFEEFCQQTKEWIACRDTKVVLRDVQKNNGVRLKAIAVEAECAPVVYLEEFYEQYKAEGFESAVQEIYKVLTTHVNTEVTNGFRKAIPKSWEDAKDRIVYQLVNYEMNAEWLKGVPHKRFLDLAIIFRYLFDTEGIGNAASFVIMSGYDEKLGVGVDELYGAACKNTPELLPCTFKSLGELFGIEELDLDAMWSLTNNRMSHGAACILYDGVLDNIREKFGRNLIIIPSSIHEVLILPVEYDEGLNDLVREVNSTSLIREEILSDHVYVYDGELKCA